MIAMVGARLRFLGPPPLPALQVGAEVVVLAISDEVAIVDHFGTRYTIACEGGRLVGQWRPVRPVAAEDDGA